MSHWYWVYLDPHSYYRLYAIGGRHYRNGTVPHTAKGKASRNQYRHMHTSQELAYLDSLARDEDVHYHKVRISRRTELQTFWDDDYPDARLNRNWKQYRRTRWKELSVV